jgi:lysozyme family protein
MPGPLEILRQRNAAAGKPAQLTTAQKAGGITGVIASILAGIYAVEGGYVNDPKDRGGATNYGVTERVARENGYLGDMRNFPKNCYGKVTVCADKIYVEKYIEKPGYTPLLTVEPAVARELVDTGVNMGPPVASRFFQASLNVLCKSGLTVDGKTGPKTIVAYQQCRQLNPKLCVTMLNALDGAQERRYRGIVAARPSQGRFLKGWLNHRIGNVDRGEC